MATGRGGRSAAAAVLQGRMDEILTAYEAALHSTDSALLREERHAARYLREARRILTHVVAELHRGTHLPLGADTPGPDGTAHGTRTHPVDSGRAAAALFDAVVVTLLAAPEEQRPSGAETAVLFSLLNRQIVARHTARSVAHSGYLLQRVRSAHHDERRRVARELHDEVAGQLGSALNWLELYDVYRDGGRPELADERLATARDAVRDSLAQLRDVMTGLRHRLGTEPLRVALDRDLALAGEHDVEVRTDVTGEESALPPGVAEELFLIVREAQRNALRHARARLVTVSVRVTPGEVRATVRDDGVGFDPRTTVPRGHSGMISMRERAELLGGSVAVESQPGRGTRIVVFVPLRGTTGADAIGVGG